MRRWQSTLHICAAALASVVGLQSCASPLARDAEAQFPPLGQMVEADGRALHYVERGSGRPVVLIHGAFGALQDFTATVFDPLATRYRTIAIDRPGHGYSERSRHAALDLAGQARSIHAALEELDVERPVLVGFSLGGSVALAYALAFPDDVAGLVTINSTTREWPGRTSWLYEVPAIPLVGDLFLYTLVMPLGLWMSSSSIERAFAPEPVAEHFARSPVALALRPKSFRANAEDMRLLEPFLEKQSARYGELAVPLVVVAAAGDIVVNAQHHSVFLHEQVAGSELTMVPNAGHQMLYAHPEVVLAAIDRVWALVDARQSARAPNAR